MKRFKTLKSCLAILGLVCSVSVYSAEYAVILKTLSNPFWVAMKEGIENEAKVLGVDVDILLHHLKEIINHNFNYSKI